MLKIIITLVLLSLSWMAFQKIRHGGDKTPPAGSQAAQTTTLNTATVNTQQVYDEISSRVRIDANSFFDAAANAEKGDHAAFDSIVYKLGAHLNNIVGTVGHLTQEQKSKMDRLLTENYTAIAENVRSAYLEKVDSTPAPHIDFITSTAYTTRAEALAAAINSTLCSFSTFIFIPLRLDISLTANIAASYLFQDPCEWLLSGVMNRIGTQLENTGMFRDLEITAANFDNERQSNTLQLSGADWQTDLTTSTTIRRSIGYKDWTLLEWNAATLTIQYHVKLTYGYDLARSVKWVHDEKLQTTTIYVPDPQLLNIDLDPTTTQADDGGVTDLDDTYFRALYDSARNLAIQRAETAGVKQKARQQLKEFLNHIFQNNHLHIIDSSSSNIQKQQL